MVTKAAAYILVITLGLLFTYFHMLYWVDTVAKYTDYFVSMGVLPIIVGLSIGSIGSFIWEKNVYNSLSKNWLLKITGALASLAPVLYYIIFMSFVSY
mgnify:CR=1 FL=1